VVGAEHPQPVGEQFLHGGCRPGLITGTRTSMITCVPDIQAGVLIPYLVGGGWAAADQAESSRFTTRCMGQIRQHFVEPPIGLGRHIGALVPGEVTADDSGDLAWILGTSRVRPRRWSSPGTRARQRAACGDALRSPRPIVLRSGPVGHTRPHSGPPASGNGLELSMVRSRPVQHYRGVRGPTLETEAATQQSRPQCASSDASVTLIVSPRRRPSSLDVSSIVGGFPNTRSIAGSNP
jgi:hypothetical protein